MKTIAVSSSLDAVIMRPTEGQEGLMKKWFVLGFLVILIGGGVAYFFDIGVSAQTKRERFVTKAKSYLEANKANEAVIEYKNALKVDPAHAQTHFDLGM